MQNSKNILEAEIGEKVFDLLHLRSMEEIEALREDALSHVEAARAAGILNGAEADEARDEVERAAVFSRIKTGGGQG